MEKVDLSKKCKKILSQLRGNKRELLYKDGDYEDIKVPLAGLNLDSVWENIVAAIGNITIVGGNSISEQIAEDDAHAKLVNQIEQLEKKARAEKQPRKKLELFEKLKELKKKI